MAKNILKEAIADAKAVREVALANAKAALEEAFTPRLQSMLSAKLSETLNEEDEDIKEEEELDEMVDMDEEDTIDEADTDEKDTVDEMAMYDEDDVEENLDEEIDLEEILNELELDEDDSEDTMEEGKAKDHDGDGDIDSNDYLAAKDKAIKKNMKKENTEDFNLDVLLEEINNLEEDTIDEMDSYDEDLDEGHCAEGMYMTKEGHCMEMAMYDEDEELNEGPEVFTAMAGLAGVFGAAGITAALETAADDPSFKEKHPKAADALKKIFGFMSKIGGAAASGIKEEETDSNLEEYVSDLAYEELRESRKALNAVKTELNEVNLLNSKLLYVNRIFKANNLDEAQKLRVVETLDNATNVKEAKLIYETIKDTFTISKENKTTPKKSIRENFGMASKAAGTSTAPKKPILNESNDMMARMQKLANIKIN